jgi:hypothetical protein
MRRSYRNPGETSLSKMAAPVPRFLALRAPVGQGEAIAAENELRKELRVIGERIYRTSKVG